MADTKTEKLFEKALTAVKRGKGRNVRIIHGMKGTWDASNYASFVKRIDAANSSDALKRLEKSLDRLHGVGALKDSEFKKLDDKILRKLSQFDGAHGMRVSTSSRFPAHIEDLYKAHKKNPKQNVVMRQLGDFGDYTRSFKPFAKWNKPVSILDGPDVVRRYRSELSDMWPETKAKHAKRAEYWDHVSKQFAKEHQRLLTLGAQKHGGNLSTHGAPLSGGAYPHWPRDLQERVRFAVHGKQDAASAARLHKKLSGKR